MSDGTSVRRPRGPAWRLAGWLRRLPVQPLLDLGARLLVPRHRLAALAVVQDDSGRVLLLNHLVRAKEWWGLPGGWVRRREDPRRAVLRELREETGLEGLVGPVVHLSRESGASHVAVFFRVEAVTVTLRLGPEVLEARWYAVADLPAELSASTRIAIAGNDGLRRATGAAGTTGR